MANPEEGGSNNERRPPHNMQGLLRFCTELTAAEDTTSPSNFEALDPERRAFLDEVLSSMTINVVKRLSSHLEKLVQDCVFTEGEDCTEAEDAMDDMKDFVDDLNHASDLYKIGGYPVLVRCLDSPHSSIRSRAADLIGETCQNDYQCQNNMYPLGVLPKLFDMVDTDSNYNCKHKALFAISCLVRDNDEGESLFISHNGFSYLLRAMCDSPSDGAQDEKLRLKAVFLLNSFISKKEDCRASLVSMGFVEKLFSILLENPSNLYKEYCTKVLLDIVKGSQEAVEEIKKFATRCEMNLTEMLKSKVDLLEGKEECQEEMEYLKELQIILKEKTDSNNVEEVSGLR